MRRNNVTTKSSPKHASEHPTSERTTIEMDEQTTDFEKGTLSTQDRERFLQGLGLRDSWPADKQQALREEWPDEDILMAMEMGFS